MAVALFLLLARSRVSAHDLPLGSRSAPAHVAGSPAARRSSAEFARDRPRHADPLSWHELSMLWPHRFQCSMLLPVTQTKGPHAPTAASSHKARRPRSHLLHPLLPAFSKIDRSETASMGLTPNVHPTPENRHCAL
ncbi:hypothetical protein AXF42_Ash005682 [Apostasia shenzhenica]|uniref:Secreted protein n=1 Tax=Apostasia shenzhenica TaxID=1088818 RepID=A0A2I0BC48_9ASPA|nr:hypothetical protein AXF42_Ash005682 [Apostasia shenzhenica]